VGIDLVEFEDCFDIGLDLVAESYFIEIILSSNHASYSVAFLDLEFGDYCSKRTGPSPIFNYNLENLVLLDWNDMNSYSIFEHVGVLEKA